jgi:CRISPR-associated protein Csb2
MGLAFWLPVGAPEEVLETFEVAVAEFSELKLGAAGIWRLEPVDAEQPARAAALRLSTYTTRWNTWATVTPAIFGKYPRRSQIGAGKDGGKVVAELTEMIGLPRPAEVRLGPISALRGVPKAVDFVPPPKFADRLRAHVWIRFAEPVQGPVLLGAGRFTGFGLCRPWHAAGIV